MSSKTAIGILFQELETKLQQRRIKINQVTRMLENRIIEKIQKIAAGASSSETTNLPSPELAGMTSTNARTSNAW